MDKSITIEEGNKIIAEFMGLEYTTKKYWKIGDVTGNNQLFDLHYHTSWDWLMPCVKKFDYLTENKVIPFSADFEFWCGKIEDAITRTYEIQPVFEIMVEAIQWYNSLPTKPHS